MLMSMSNLTLVLQYQRKYEKTEKMNQQALKESEKMLEREHSDTLMSMSNLTLVLQYQRKYKKAEKMNQ